MKFLKSSTGASQALPDSALVARLRAVTHRGNVEGASYPPLEEPLKAEGQQKVFWTPDEAAADSH
jgi:hypothetical protein